MFVLISLSLALSLSLSLFHSLSHTHTHTHARKDFVALRPRKRDGLLGMGTEWEGDERVKARPQKPPKKDRRDRGPPPEQWKC